MHKAFIYDAIRTARGRGRADGGLADLSPLQCLEALYKALQERTPIDADMVEDVILGCVTQAGEQGGNIAKTSLLFAGWPDHIPGVTLNRFCSSGLDAINFASLKVQAGQARCTLAGGVEMMSRVPMLSDNAVMFADAQLALDNRMLMMGSGADLIASLHNISREALDLVAYNSQQRAARARAEGRFKSIIPVHNPVKDILVDRDECIRPELSCADLAQLKPYFAELGSSGVDRLQLSKHSHIEKIQHLHTAGNSPAMADAAALVLVGDASLKTLGMQPRAQILASATVCDDPLQVVSGCAAATEKLLADQGYSAADIDLFEIHEAFAATSIKCQQQLGIDDRKFNVNGGVIALGHPMGATGSIMMGMLIDELELQGLRRGIVATSGAAGTGTAMLIELVGA